MAQSSSSSSGTVTPASGKSTLAHQKRGVGYGARFSIQEKDLPPGWRCEKRSPKYTLWYDDKGHKYRSSSEVEYALRAHGWISDTAISETETETGGDTSEYESSPVKMPRKQDV